MFKLIVLKVLKLFKLFPYLFSSNKSFSQHLEYFISFSYLESCLLCIHLFPSKTNTCGIVYTVEIQYE